MGHRDNLKTNSKAIYYSLVVNTPYSFIAHYGNTGCQVFKQCVQNWKDFCLKINIPKGKILNFENWVNGEVSKSAIV